MSTLSILYLALAAFLRYDNVWFIFPVPCWAIPLGRWQCLVYFPTLCACIVHDDDDDDIYIYIYMYMSVCLKKVMHFVWWTHMVKRATLSWSWVLLTLECGYAFKATAIGAYSCYIVCMIIIVWLSWSMSTSDIGFPVYVTCINMVDALVSFFSP